MRRSAGAASVVVKSRAEWMGIWHGFFAANSLDSSRGSRGIVDKTAPSRRIIIVYISWYTSFTAQPRRHRGRCCVFLSTPLGDSRLLIGQRAARDPGQFMAGPAFACSNSQRARVSNPASFAFLSSRGRRTPEEENARCRSLSRGA